MLSNIKTAAIALVSALGTLAYVLMRMFRSQRDTARQERDAERGAREALQDTQEATREVDDDIRRSTPDQRRERLRQYTSGSGGDD